MIHESEWSLAWSSCQLLDYVEEDEEEDEGDDTNSEASLVGLQRSAYIVHIERGRGDHAI